MNEGSVAVSLPRSITVQEYLDGETRSEERHEFRDGIATSRAGASRRHERVSMNLSSRIPSLEEYAVVSQWQDRPEVTVFRRESGWEPGETYTSGEVTFLSIGLTISVGSLYRAE